MSTFPLEPQLAKMLIVSPEFKCSNEILSIAAMLSVPNPYLRPNSQRKEADEAKAQFAHPDGDHLSLLNLYHAYRGNPDANWCWSNYVSFRAMQQADNVRNQLKRSMEKMDLSVLPLFPILTHVLILRHRQGPRLDLVRGQVVLRQHPQGAHVRLLHARRPPRGRQGLVHDRQGQPGRRSAPLHWARQQPRVGPLQRSVVPRLPFSPSSHLRRCQPPEFVLTTRNFIRTVTEVRPEWLMEFAAEYYDIKSFPVGEQRRALERVLLKKEGKAPRGGEDGREKKKRKKDKK